MLVNVFLCILNFILGFLVQLLNLLGRYLTELVFYFLARHHVDLEALNDENWHIKHLTGALILLHLLREAALVDVQDPPMIMLLAIVEPLLNCYRIRLQILAFFLAYFLYSFFSALDNSTVDAPDEG